MRVEAHLKHATLNRLICDIAPIRIHMAPPGGATRWLELDEPSLVQPVIGRGLRLHASGRFRFHLAGLPLTARIRRISLVLEPHLVEREGMPFLAFSIDLEEGDLAHVPKLFERPLVRRINRALSPKNTKMAWAFADTLTHRFVLPERLEPLDSLAVASRDADVTVDAHAVHFAFDLALEVERFGEIGEDQDVQTSDAFPTPATSAAFEPMAGLDVEV